LSACTSHASTTPTTGGVATTGTSGSGTSSSSSSSSTIPAGSACAARVLDATVTGTSGAAGTFEVTFALRNTSATACPMNGFPGIQLVGGSGAQLATHVVSGGNYQFTNFAPSPVMLGAGATANFNLAYSDVPVGTEASCPAVAQIQITPPHASDHDTVPVQWTVCGGGTVTVSPVFGAGSPGSQTTAPPQH
jgi:hypothetical protein